MPEHRLQEQILIQTPVRKLALRHRVRLRTDVRISPSLDFDGRAVTVIELQSNTGSFVAQARTPEIYEFVTGTLSIVPLGSEVIDVDKMIDTLLPSI